MILGWSSDYEPTSATILADNSADDAIYKGLALAGGRLYATDFHNGKVVVFDGQMHEVTSLGANAFVDLNAQSGFAPFGIRALDGELWVTYAKQDDNREDDVAGVGNGFVDVYDTDGALTQRFASGGELNSPWAVVRAPSDFGDLGGRVLIGNFGDGRILAFKNANDPSPEALLDQSNNQISIDGLWSLEFGNGANAGARDTLFFTAGPDEEQHGLFGKLEAR